jgi:phosphopantetheine--protein transferase-like protein
MDVVDVVEVGDAIGVFGERYQQRIATSRERVGWPAGPALKRHAAGAFAAKEAVLKALGGDADTVRWKDIELRQRTPGEWNVALQDDAAALALQAGVSEISVSIGTTTTLATAIAIATTT